MPDMSFPVPPPVDVTVPRVATPGDLDRLLHTWQSRFTGGRSPSTVALACLDWMAHAANTPFQAEARLKSAVAQWQRLMLTALGGASAIVPPPEDHRFQAAAWQKRPYNLLA